MLALPALEATGLLACAGRVFGALPNGFYGPDTVLLEAVLRTLAGQPALRAPPGSSRPHWVGSSAWTGSRRSDHPVQARPARGHR